MDHSDDRMIIEFEFEFQMGHISTSLFRIRKVSKIYIIVYTKVSRGFRFDRVVGWMDGGMSKVYLMNEWMNERTSSSQLRSDQYHGNAVIISDFYCLYKIAKKCLTELDIYRYDLDSSSKCVAWQAAPIASEVKGQKNNETTRRDGVDPLDMEN